MRLNNYPVIASRPDRDDEGVTVVLCFREDHEHAEFVVARVHAAHTGEGWSHGDYHSNIHKALAAFDRR